MKTYAISIILLVIPFTQRGSLKIRSVMLIVTNLKFKLSNSSLKIEKMLLQVSLLCLQGSDLLLELCVLTFLSMIALFHVVFSSMNGV